MSRWLREAKISKQGEYVIKQILNLKNLGTTKVKLVETDNFNWRPHVGKLYNLKGLLDFFDENTRILDIERDEDYINLTTRGSEYKFQIINKNSDESKSENDSSEPNSEKDGDINYFIGKKVRMVDSTNKNILDQVKDLVGTFGFKQYRLAVQYPIGKFESSTVVDVNVSGNSIEIHTSNSMYKFEIVSD